MNFIDRVPRYIRILIGIPSVFIILKVYNIKIFPKLWIPNYFYLALFILPIFVTVYLFYYFKKHKKIISQTQKNNYNIFEIEFNGSKEDSINLISSLIKDRSRNGKIKYGIISITSGSYSRSFIIVGGINEKDVEIESEVLKTLLSTSFKNIKIKDVEIREKELLYNAIDSISPIGKGEILLILPEKGIQANSHNEIYLGKAFDGAYSRDIYLSKNDLENHVAIFGSTGNGKSTTAVTLAYRSSPFCNVLILDWTGEYEESLKDSNIISVLSNPFDPFKIKEVNGREDILIDSLSSSLGLTQPQQYMLMKIIEDNRPSSLSDLIKKIENYEEESRWDRDVKRGLLRKIEMLNNSVKENKNSFSIDMIKNGINIVRLSEINSINARKAFALFLLAIIYLEKSRNGRNLLIVIDEAQNLLESEGGSLIEQMMAESRKYGINIVLSTQSPSMVPNNILLNANTKIIHALKSARDKEIIASSMNLSRDLLNQLDKLDKGEAIIQSVSLPNPIIVRVEPINEIRNKSEKVFKGKPIDIDPKV